MTKKYIFPFFFLLTEFLVVSCSTSQDTFINRKYHAMTTEYNILYNGEIAFQKGIHEINQKYEDNYWKVLPIEPLTINESKIEVPDYKKISSGKKDKNKESEESKNLTPFEVAEEKAVKAVQKHSMNINGKEKNSRIDEAFLLLGKSRYYTSRFVPSMEAFNYVVKNYPEANLIEETIVWRAKANVRMQNEEIAISDLEEFLEKDEIKNKNLEDAHLTLALAYSQLDSVSLVINNLEKAIEVSGDITKKSRSLFILGQLYREENKLVDSQRMFEQIINLRNAPYRYKIHAEIEKVKNFQLLGTTQEAIPRLEKLIKIRENRPYLDELYYHLALLQKRKGNRDIALLNYQRSVHVKNAKKFQKGLSYEAVGDLYFDETDYATASSFYDSVLQVSGEVDSKRIRKIRRKKQSLESVLTFEDVIFRNDSIWRVLSMEKEEQIDHFQGYIVELKRKEKESKEQKDFLEDLKRFEDLGLANSRKSEKSFGKKGDWYFYSDQTVSFGSQEFKRIWGSRILADNWRLSNNMFLSENESDNGQVKENKISEELPEKYKVDYYIDQLPSTLREIDSISNLRSSTYYQLGLIYKEQFKEYELAAETLETLIEIFPEDKLVLGTNYHLFKIYEATGDSVKADYYSSVVVRRFPNSVFAQMILIPNEVLDKKSTKTAEGTYREIYFTYKSGDYLNTIYDISKALRTFEGMPIIPKLELLKAYAFAQTKGKKAFMSALDYIVLNYSNTEEGKKAKELMEKLK